MRVKFSAVSPSLSWLVTTGKGFLETFLVTSASLFGSLEGRQLRYGFHYLCNRFRIDISFREELSGQSCPDSEKL